MTITLPNGWSTFDTGGSDCVIEGTPPIIDKSGDLNPIGANPGDGTINPGNSVTCVTLTVTNGVPPYTWSTTKGTLTDNGDGTATLCCPANTGAGVSGQAYGIATKFGICGGFCDCVCRFFNCNDTAYGGGGCLNTSCGQCWQQGSGSPYGCSCTDCHTNGSDVLSYRQGSWPTWCGRACTCSNACACLIQTNVICDKRTQSMIDQGCNPCYLSMNGGAIVSVTDERGLTAYIFVDRV